MSDISHEFPDFDVTTLPQIPAGFEPAHWGSEPMPHWTKGRISLFIDYPDPALREYDDVKRFSLHLSLTPFYGEDMILLVASDDWQDILSHLDTMEG